MSNIIDLFTIVGYLAKVLTQKG